MWKLVVAVVALGFSTNAAARNHYSELKRTFATGNADAFPRPMTAAQISGNSAWAGYCSWINHGDVAYGGYLALEAYATVGGETGVKVLPVGHAAEGRGPNYYVELPDSSSQQLFQYIEQNISPNTTLAKRHVIHAPQVDLSWRAFWPQRGVLPI
jgi:hypothetical protein